MGYIEENSNMILYIRKLALEVLLSYNKREYGKTTCLGAEKDTETKQSMARRSDAYKKLEQAVKMLRESTTESVTDIKIQYCYQLSSIMHKTIMQRIVIEAYTTEGKQITIANVS